MTNTKPITKPRGGMKPYRCQNEACSTDDHGRLIFDFWAEQPVCPKCGADGREGKFRHIVIALSLVHFDPPSQVRGVGQRTKACDSLHYANGQVATGNPNSVTCPVCKATDVYQRVAEQWGMEVVAMAENEEAALLDINARAAAELVRLKEQVAA